MKNIINYINGILYPQIRAFLHRWEGKLRIGKKFIIGSDSCLDRYMGGSITVGDNVTICRGCKIATCGGNLIIGSGTQIGDRTIITAQGGVIIGLDVLFADRVTIIANEHNYEDIQEPIMNQGGYKKPVIIGDGSWIGINTTILQGSTIGRNSVVGAGSVVKGKFPDYSVIAGNPARIIKRFDKDINKWIRV